MIIIESRLKEQFLVRFSGMHAAKCSPNSLLLRLCYMPMEPIANWTPESLPDGFFSRIRGGKLYALLDEGSAEY